MKTETPKPSPGRPAKYGQPMTAAQRKAAERARMRAKGMKQRQIWIPQTLKAEPGQQDADQIAYAISKQLDRITGLETDYGPFDLTGDRELITLIQAAISPVLERRLADLKEQDADD